MRRLSIYVAMVMMTFFVAFTPRKVRAAEGKRESVKKSAPIYGIGSVSKVMTTAGIMKLCDSKLVDLDEPVTTYIPEFRMADERYRKITVRMLLNHSSGLYGMTDNNAQLIADNSTYAHDNLLQMLEIQQLKHEPGDRSIYCNDGFTLAEILIERVSGMDYTKFLKKYLMEPQGVTDLYSPLSDFDRTRMAPIGYENVDIKGETLNLIGSGGLYATAEDLCKFASMFSGKIDVLSKESLDEMEKFQSAGAFLDEDDDTIFGYGLGWDSVNTYPFDNFGIKAVSKGGSTGFYKANLTVLPEHGISAAVVSSGAGNYDQLIAQEIILGVLEEEGLIESSEIVIPEYAKESQPIPEVIEAHAGLYGGVSLFEVRFEEQEMIIQPKGTNVENEFYFQHIGDGEFVSRNGEYLGMGSLMSASDGNTGIMAINFVENELGEQYLVGKSYIELAGLSKTASMMPFAMKLPDEPADEGAVEAWKSRVDQNYLLVNERHTSSEYLSGAVAKLYVHDAGYVYSGIYKNSGRPINGTKIIDNNLAVPFQSIPVMAGRDANEVRVLQEKGKEFLEVNAYRYISEKDILETSNVQDHVIINADGYTVWMKVAVVDGGKTWQVEVPETGAYFVYDKEFKCVASSLEVNARNYINLPEDGYVAFAGEPGTDFSMELLKS